jgi:Glycosyl Hydrolase Family 88.
MRETREIALEPLCMGPWMEEGDALDPAFIERSIRFVLDKIDANLATFTHQFPAAASRDLVYPATENKDWTTSFWTGMLWLAYEVTGDAKYREAAEIQVKSFTKRAETRFETDTHDLGFLYSLSCVAAYKLTGSEEAKATALLAAELLMERYVEQAGILQAWGDMNDPEQQGRMIIDCNMNLPLLYWASEQTGDPKYAQAAKNHVKQAANYIVRDDASTYHTYYMDVVTGEPRFGQTHQGYDDNSCWARGQAWGIYGFPLSYTYTQDNELLTLTKKLSHYFLNRLPKDGISYWDLIFVYGNEQERDSSAAAITACGLLELYKHLDAGDWDRGMYRQAAWQIVKALSVSYTTAGEPHSNGVLKHGVYNKPRKMGIDECVIWGDYYYFEALVRLSRDWKSYW